MNELNDHQLVTNCLVLSQYLHYIVGSSKSRNSKAKESTSLPSADESDSQSSLKVGGPSSAKRIRYDGEDSLDG